MNDQQNFKKTFIVTIKKTLSKCFSSTITIDKNGPNSITLVVLIDWENVLEKISNPSRKLIILLENEKYIILSECYFPGLKKTKSTKVFKGMCFSDHNLQFHGNIDNLC